MRFVAWAESRPGFARGPSTRARNYQAASQSATSSSPLDPEIASQACRPLPEPLRTHEPPREMPGWRCLRRSVVRVPPVIEVEIPHALLVRHRNLTLVQVVFISAHDRPYGLVGKRPATGVQAIANHRIKRLAKPGSRGRALPYAQSWQLGALLPRRAV
jgi:hypothetical protein